MQNILQRIITDKAKAVAAAQAAVPLADLQKAARAAGAPRPFFAAVTRKSATGINLIAEIKRRSPSAGLIREPFDPAAIADCYHHAGAAAISVLTDEPYFDGRLAYIDVVRSATPLPVLRKDFMIDAYQVWEARAAGADAVLLIAEVLDDAALARLASLAGELGMAVLVEGHAPQRLLAAIAALGDPLPGHVLIGINNRDLTVQRTDLQTTAQVAAHLPSAVPLVSESGIRTRDDVTFIQRAGACAMLVGESILKTEDMTARIHELLGST